MYPAAACARNRLHYLEITGASTEQAEFFLQSSNGDLDVSNIISSSIVPALSHILDGNVNIL